MSDAGASPTGCYWCGATPLTREHLIPEWLLAVLADVSPSNQGFDSAWDFVTDDGDTSRVHPVRRPEVVVRSVCKPCNETWMSELESQTIPILGPLVRGVEAQLPMADQVVLARWAAKTAVLLDTYQDGAIVLSDGDKDQIRFEGIAPTSFHIRLGLRSDAVETPTNIYVAGMNTRPAGSTGPASTGANGFAVTFGVGHVAICVYGGPGFNQPERWARGGHMPMMIWPPTQLGLAWPPTTPIINNSDELRAFHEGIFETVESSFRSPDARAIINADPPRLPT